MAAVKAMCHTFLACLSRAAGIAIEAISLALHSRPSVRHIALRLDVFYVLGDFRLLKEMDQRIRIKFCVKNEIKCNKESAMSKTRVYEWYKRFQDGREDVEDDERPGRPSASTTDENVEKVEEMVMNDRRITIREVADDIPW